MATTPIWALPYPGYDNPGDGPDGFLDLCTRLESLLTSIDSRLDKLEIATVSTAGCSANTGFTVVSDRLMKVGSIVGVSCRLRRTGANIVAPSPSGNVANTPMFGVTPPFRPVSGATGSLQTSGTGPLAGGFIDSSGSCQLTAMIPGDTWATGEEWTWSGAWIVV